MINFLRVFQILVVTFSHDLWKYCCCVFLVKWHIFHFIDVIFFFPLVFDDNPHCNIVHWQSKSWHWWLFNRFININNQKTKKKKMSKIFKRKTIFNIKKEKNESDHSLGCNDLKERRSRRLIQTEIEKTMTLQI